MYSNAFSGGGDNLQQVIEWTKYVSHVAHLYML